MQEVPTRQEFLYLTTPQIIAFYVMMAISHGIFFYQVALRVRAWMRGKPLTWKPDIVKGFAVYVLAQKKVRTSRPFSGSPLHLMIFYGFLTLFIGTTLLAINTYSPWKFHKGTYFLTYEFTLDVMGLVLFIGLIWALSRRLLARPPSLKHDASDYAGLFLLLALTITGFIVEAARMQLVPKPFNSSAPVGYFLSGYLPPLTPTHYVWLWWLHAVLVALFVIVLPQMRIRHLFYALLSTAYADPQAHPGKIPTETLEDVEKTGKVGASAPEDYTQWHLLSLDACMECGRCTEVCPAYGVGKPLDPRKVVQDILSLTKTPHPNGDRKTVGEAVSPEALWACTTCNACVEVCPVLIRHVDLIVGARRNLVSEGKLPPAPTTTLRLLQSTGSAWGQPPTEREGWIQEENIPLARVLDAQGRSFEFLLWAGCSASLDPKANRSLRTLARLMKKMGLSFACLGNEERCTGDPARRIGDDFLFQEHVAQNAATFQKYRFRKIVTLCPHCYNTFKNEYPEFGVRYEVIHHTQLLREGIQTGRLAPPRFQEGEVVLHDPCYLARVNQEVDAPRIALGVPSSQNNLDTPIGVFLSDPMDVPGNRLVEPPHFGKKTLCCGAGGGRMWMEEEPNQRPALRRTRELLQTGAFTIAVACPFCRIMIETGLLQIGADHVALQDIVDLVGEANP
jgi:Fe-S oxidoreductase/nitrate reductase gamma subunit